MERQLVALVALHQMETTTGPAPTDKTLLHPIRGRLADLVGFHGEASQGMAALQTYRPQEVRPPRIAALAGVAEVASLGLLIPVREAAKVERFAS